MSEGGGEALGPPYTTGGGFPSSQPPTASSTITDVAGGTDPNCKSSSSSGLPPFSSFNASELAEGLGSRLGPEGFGTEPFTGRLLDFSSWTYYDEGLSGRLLDRGDGLPPLIPLPQYRPWESKPLDGNSQDAISKIYEYPGSPVASKLPSFQSQFNAFPPDQNGETISLTTLTPAPPSPTANNSGLPSFHTLSTVAVNPRGYPLVPAPMQAREIPTIQQQFLDERHIHLFQSPPALNNTQYHQLGIASANPTSIIQGNFVTTGPQNPQQATLLTVVKTEPVAIVTTQLHQQGNMYHNSNVILGHESIKLDDASSAPRGLLHDSRKKERRKIRAPSLDSSIESDGVGSSSVESSGQVAAISSTAGFKSTLIQQHAGIGSLSANPGPHESEECENGSGEKQTKKKRKRCGECIGCQRKDNCGDCAPCRNDKSHQICKMRRCEKLTDKKHLLYLTNEYPRTESRRGRGKGSRASSADETQQSDKGYRNKGTRGSGSGNNTSNTSQNTSTTESGTTHQQQSSVSTGTDTVATTQSQLQSSQTLTLNGNESSPGPLMATADHSPGSVMPFYGSSLQPTAVVTETSNFPSAIREHRFTNAVWQQPTDPAAIGAWTPQGQFIQQLPTHQIEELRYHSQYTNTGSPVTVSSYGQPSPGYQQPQATFLPNGQTYQTSQTPSPLLNGNSTASRSTSSLNGTIEYVDASPRPAEYINGAYASTDVQLVPQPSSTPNSRCSSVQNLDPDPNSIAPSKTPTSATTGYLSSVVTVSGNGMPGYPPQQPPQSQQSSLNSSGYPGQITSVPHRFIREDGNLKPQVEGKSKTAATWTKDQVANDSNWQMHHNKQTENKQNVANHTMMNSNTMQIDNTFATDDRNNLNNRLKTMILNKQVNHQYQQQNQYQQQTPDHHQQQQMHQHSILQQQQIHQIQQQQIHQIQQQQQQPPSPQMQPQTQQLHQQQQLPPSPQMQPQTQQLHQQQMQLQQQQQPPSPQMQPQTQLHQQKMQLQQQQHIQQQQQLQHQQLQVRQHQHMQLQQQQQIHQQVQQQQNMQKQQQQLQQQMQQQQQQQQIQHSNPQIHQIQQNQPMQQQARPQSRQDYNQSQVQHVQSHSQTQQQQQIQQQMQQQQQQQMQQQQQQQQQQQMQQQQQQMQQQQQQIQQQQQQQQMQQQQQQQIQQQQQQQMQHQIQQQQQMQQQMQQQQIAQDQSHPQNSPQSNDHVQTQQTQVRRRRISSATSPKSSSDNQRNKIPRSLESPNSEQQTSKCVSNYKQPQYMQQHSEQYLENNVGTKSQQIHGSNFLVQGHHPRNLRTEGGGFWSTPPNNINNGKELSAMENFLKYTEQKNNDFLSAQMKLNSGPKATVQYNGNVKNWNQEIQNSGHGMIKSEPYNNFFTIDMTDSKNEVYNGKPIEHRPIDFQMPYIKQEPIDPAYEIDLMDSEDVIYNGTPIQHRPFDFQIPHIKEEPVDPSYDHSIQGTQYSQNEECNYSTSQKCYQGTFNGGYKIKLENEVKPYCKKQPDKTNKNKITVIDNRPQHILGELGEFPKIPFGTDPRIKNYSDDRKYAFMGDGGPLKFDESSGPWCCRQGGTEPPTSEHLKDGCCQGMQTLDELLDGDMEQLEINEKIKTESDVTPDDKVSSRRSFSALNASTKEFQDSLEKLRSNIKTEIPECNCFPAEKFPAEPGSYYTHLGAAASLADLRKDVEGRIGLRGNAIRIEKIVYTGKEGKTTQGCPLAKWVIRRSSNEEKVLIVVKNRKGHVCPTAWIVVVLVAWEGVPSEEADGMYDMLTHKLTRYGLPTLRRCETNEPRTCACQGLDPDGCGASFSFGCSWSMYYNGCKYARSKTVRKFRLSVRGEEQEIEQHLHSLATMIAPLYKVMAPQSFKNMTQFEREALDCRLGFKPGRPWSGVTACVDFCAHAHKDIHNMNNGCTTVVNLTKHRGLSKPEDEQLHVLPLYVLDESDEFGSKENQHNKIKNGAIEILSKFPCEVRIRSIPLQPCRRHGKKRKDEEDAALAAKKEPTRHRSQSVDTNAYQNGFSPMDANGYNSLQYQMQLQSSQVSSTVLDSPVYQSWPYRSINTNNGGNPTDIFATNQWPLHTAHKYNGWYGDPAVDQFNYNLWVNGGDGRLSDVKAYPDSTTHMSRSSSSRSVGSATPDMTHNYDSLNSPCSKTGSSNSSNFSNPLTPNNLATNDISRKISESKDQVKSNKSPASSPLAPHQVQCHSSPVPPQYHQIRQSSTPVLSPNTSSDWGTPDPAEPSWDYSSPGTPIPSTSPFRVPRGRPPSQTPNKLEPSSNSTKKFVKPLPPLDQERNDQRNNSFYDQRNRDPNANTFHSAQKYDPRKSSATNGVSSIPEYSSIIPSNSPKYSNSQSSPNYRTPYSLYTDRKPVQSWGNQSLYMDSPGQYLHSQYAQNNPTISPHHPYYNSYQGTPSLQFSYWDPYGTAAPVPQSSALEPKTEPLGEVTDYIENEECFKDPQMGGVAIALGHGAVLFECAKHELHATTALRRPNRHNPTRISLVFYQHRNLNRSKHGLDEWEEKMRLRKLNSQNQPSSPDAPLPDFANLVPNVDRTPISASPFMIQSPTHTTMTWTTLFPMYPCITVGPYQGNPVPPPEVG